MNAFPSVAIAGLLIAGCAGLPPATPVAARLAAEWDGGARTVAIWPGGLGGGEDRARSAFIAGARAPGGVVLHDLNAAAMQSADGAALGQVEAAALPLDNGYAVVIGGVLDHGSAGRLAFFRLQPAEDRTIAPWGEVDTGLGRLIGLCMRQWQGVLQAVAVDADGRVRQFTVGEGEAGEPTLTDTRRFRVEQPGPGCAIDPAGRIYFSHRRGGFWSYPLAPAASPTGSRTSAAPGHTPPRSAALAFLSDRGAGYLTTLDPDGSGFSVWRVDGPEPGWAGRVRVLDSSDRPVGRIRDIDAYGGDLPGFEGGLVVVRTGRRGTATRLVLVAWEDVKRALGL